MSWAIVAFLVIGLPPFLSWLFGDNVVPRLWRWTKDRSWGTLLKRLGRGLCAIVGRVLWLVVAPAAFCLRCAGKSISCEVQVGETGEPAEVPPSIPFGRGAPRFGTPTVRAIDLTARQPRAPSRGRPHRRDEASAEHQGTRRPGPQTALYGLTGRGRSEPARAVGPPSGSDTVVPAPEAAPSRGSTPIGPPAPTADSRQVPPPRQLTLTEIDFVVDGPSEPPAP